MHRNELYHTGRKGMKWYHHIYTKKDGTLTKVGNKKAAKLAYKYNRLTGKNVKNSKVITKKIKQNSSLNKYNLSNMTDEELKTKSKRINLENNYMSAISQHNETYRRLNPKSISKGKKFIDDVVVGATTEVGKKALKIYMEKKLLKKIR